jgi:penicillin-binding protein 1A
MDYSTLGNRRRLRRRSPHATRIRNKVGLLSMRAVVWLVLIVGFGVTAMGFGLYMGILADSPNLHEDALTAENRMGRIVCSFTGEELFRLHYAQNQEFVMSFDVFPQHLIDAFIAIEDERFWEHNGVDLRGIVRATQLAVTRQANQGASTITQQLIKNMLGRFDSDLVTKLQEQYLAVTLERQLTEALGCRILAKEHILMEYLNIINLGRHNFGVQAAAWFYYDVDVQDLTLAQAATIAAITQNPTRFPPDIRPVANWQRTRLVLYNMYHRLGLITTEEYEYATRERQHIDAHGLPEYDEYGYPVMVGLVYDTIFRRPDGGRGRDLASEFDCFHDAMLNQVAEHLAIALNITFSQADRLIFTSGLTIYSAQCRRMQAAVDRVFLDESYWPTTAASGFQIEVDYDMRVFNTVTLQSRSYRLETTVRNMDEAWEFINRRKAELLAPTDEYTTVHARFLPQPQGAFVIMDHHNGFVRALRGIRGEKEGSRVFNRATQSERSPGSQMKPLVPFAPAFDMGIMQPGTVIDDIPFTLYQAGAAPWTPGNWWSHNLPYEGLSTARRAIYRSQNVVSARAAADVTIPSVGVPMMRSYLENNFGFTTIQPTDGAAMVLGGMHGVRLIELVGAYAAIANMGEFNTPLLYTRVVDYFGNLLLDGAPQPTRALQPATAYLLIDTMRDTLTRAGSTGSRANWTNAQMRRDIPIAGKTGTSQNNADLGFTGFTAYYTAGFWLGNDNNTGMARGSQGASQFHLPIWRSIMEEIHYGYEPRTFVRPPGVTSVTICRDSGMRATELCRQDPRGSRAVSEIFAPGRAPLHDCTVHVEFTMCSRHQMAVGEHCDNLRGDGSYNIVTLVGIVRPQPIDDITEVVADRRWEVPLAVRNGEVCVYCIPGANMPPAEDSPPYEPFQPPPWDPFAPGGDDDTPQEDLPETPPFVPEWPPPLFPDNDDDDE